MLVIVKSFLLLFSALKKKQLLFIVKPHSDANESVGLCRFHFTASLFCLTVLPGVYSPAKQNSLMILQPIPTHDKLISQWLEGKKTFLYRFNFAMGI